MRNLKINTLLLVLLSITFTACAEKHDDKTFWVKLYNTTPTYDKTNGGKFVSMDSVLRVGQYNNLEKIFQKYKGPIKGSIVSVWSVTRLPNGKADTYGICGNQVESPTNYLEKSYDSDNYKYKMKRTKRKNCVKKLQAQDELDKVNQYFYARSKPSLKITYPPKTPNHSHWEATVYNGRVGDLTPEALTQEQKDNLHKLRKHECYKWSSPKRGSDCYDLEGNDTSLYYTIREHLSSPPTKDGVLSSQWEGLKDIRISPPQKWVEIKGISINKEQYDYLSEVCKKGEEYCHLNDYTGKLTKAEKEYMDSVKYGSDK